MPLPDRSTAVEHTPEEHADDHNLLHDFFNAYEQVPAVYSQAAEPVGAVAGALWIDTDEVASPITTTEPACRVYHNANQSIAASTLTVLAFNSERFDNDTMHDPAVANSRITIRTAGVYVVSASILWSAGAGDWTASLSLWLNGATYIARQQVLGLTTGDAAITVTTAYKFVVGDYVECRVWQNSGTEDVLAVGNMSPEFSAVRVSDG